MVNVKLHVSLEDQFRSNLLYLTNFLSHRINLQSPTLYLFYRFVLQRNVTFCILTELVRLLVKLFLPLQLFIVVFNIKMVRGDQVVKRDFLGFLAQDFIVPCKDLLDV